MTDTSSDRTKSRVSDAETRKVVQSLRDMKGGDTLTSVAERTGLSRHKVGRVFAHLAASHQVVEAQVLKRAGRNTRTYTGWRLAEAAEDADGRQGVPPPSEPEVALAADGAA